MGRSAFCCLLIVANILFSSYTAQASRQMFTVPASSVTGTSLERAQTTGLSAQVEVALGKRGRGIVAGANIDPSACEYSHQNKEEFEKCMDATAEAHVDYIYTQKHGADHHDSP